MTVVATEPSRQTIPLWPWGYAAAGALALAAALTAPLAAYVFMIALFGLPHVVCEMRYCDERFSPRAPRAALPIIGVVLLLLAALRISQGFNLLPSALTVPAELSLGIGLTATAVWFMPQRHLLGVLAGVTLTCGAVFAPITTFLIFAWLHNLTPLAFISEILPKRERARILLLLSMPFIALPALVASGVLQQFVHELFGYSAASAPSLFGAGQGPISAFLATNAPRADAVTLFSAALVAQAMHYFSVIVVMPRLLARGGKTANGTLVSWPSWKNFYIAVALFGATMLAFHAADYHSAHLVYSVAAALHSWVELPIFLIALGFGFSEAPARGSRLATIGS
ncbi:MAG: hypothetical protein WAW96_04090 [Alphaproteobacteria bacterium]